jgi:dynein intermediate chain
VDAHFGLLTSISPHHSSARVFKNLLLTSSVDWTVKLWNLSLSATPLMEFFTPSYDYVCGVEWSPVNAPVFATITSGGAVNLWNLSKSIMEPVDTLMINKSPTANSQSGRAVASSPALNKFAWMKDGRKMIVGDGGGLVHLVSVQDAAAVSKQGDESKFEHMLFSHKSNASFKP